MPFDGGLNTKPGVWEIAPELTAAPELWRYNPIVYPLWQGSSNALALNGRVGTLISGAQWGSAFFGRSLDSNGGYLSFDRWDGGPKVTLLWYGAFANTASAIEQISAADSNSSLRRTFQFRRTASGIIQFIVFVGGAAKTATSTTTVGTAPTAIVARNDGANASVFVGKPTAEGTVASGNMDTDDAGWALATRLATISGTPSETAVNLRTGIFVRIDDALSDAEVARFIADPFALIRPRDDSHIPAIFGDLGGGATTATGTLEAQAAATTGAAVRTAKATGSLSAQPAAISASAFRAAQAAAAMQAQLAAIVGAASREAKAEGAPQAQAAEVVGVAGGPSAEIIRVGAVGDVADGSATTNVTLPDGDNGPIVEGDMVIAYIGHDDGALSISTSGYENINFFTGGRWDYKFMGATPDSQVAVANSSAVPGTIIVEVWRNVSLSNPFDGGVVTSGGTGGMPDVGEKSISFSNSRLVALGALDDDDVGASVTAPADYELLTAQDTGQASTTAGFTLMVASYAPGIAGAYDPDAFGGSGSDFWSGRHFALRATGTNPTATGALQAQQPVMDGSAVRSGIEASGTPKAQDAVIDGAATRTAFAEGTPKAQDAVIDGDAIGGKVLAQGTLQAGDSTMSGLATRVFNAIGILQAGASQVVGSATIVVAGTATGVLKAGASVIDGAASRGAKATGALQSGAAAVVGLATRAAAAIGVLKAGLARIVGRAKRGWHVPDDPVSTTWADTNAASTTWTDAPSGETDWEKP